MTDEQKQLLLEGINHAMAEVQQCAEGIARNVMELEKAGVELPSMRRTAEVLAQIALGWEAAGRL